MAGESKAVIRELRDPNTRVTLFSDPSTSLLFDLSISTLFWQISIILVRIIGHRSHSPIEVSSNWSMCRCNPVFRKRRSKIVRQ